MKNKITKGEWIANNSNNSDYIDVDCNGQRITSILIEREDSISKQESKSNAALIAEAGTVANLTGLSPKELMDQRDELLENLKTVYNWAKNGNQENLIVFEQALKIINKSI